MWSKRAQRKEQEERLKIKEQAHSDQMNYLVRAWGEYCKVKRVLEMSRKLYEEAREEYVKELELNPKRLREIGYPLRPVLKEPLDMGICGCSNEQV